MSERDATALRDRIARIDGAGYKRYREIVGAWDLPGFTLFVDHAQSDPFATPSPVRVELDRGGTGIPEDAARTNARRLGAATWLAARFAEAASEVRGRGTGRSGEVRMEHPGQTVLPQTAVIVDGQGGLEARFSVGLPGRGRRVDGAGAAELLLGTVPDLVRRTLVLHDAAAVEVAEAAETNEDAEALRAFLHKEGLIAFVADGARLPRASGIDDRPLETDGVVPFESPPTLRTRVDLPNAGTVTGMALRPGVTLVTGGGFHGKSTLLRALESGVYDHRPGDGRERVVTRADAVKIRAEDGRSVQGVDISGFIDGLPFGRDTRAFETPDASGSTSQAASIVEALEAGARVLLIDEDTSATNFMTRDRRMQDLVPASGEPIKPFVDRVRVLWEAHGVSTVLVVGGTGDYLNVADTVVRMEAYRPADVTTEARRVAEQHPTGRRTDGDAGWTLPPARSIDLASLDARRGKRPTYVRVPDRRTLRFGRHEIDVSAVEQLASRAQLRTIGLAMARLAEGEETPSTVPELLDRIERILADPGLDALDPRGDPRGDLAGFRRHELAATLNRLRSLRVGGDA
jgi:predicted ABC-class ATPase